MRKNTKIFIGGSLIIISILSLLLIATPKLSGTEVALEEVLQQPVEYNDRYIMTQGLLIEDSIKWNPDLIELKFNIQDENGNILKITHNGVKPDNFSDGVIVIVEGNIDQQGNFIAEKLQTKCPSKYEGEDPEDYDKEYHKQYLNSDSNQ